MSNFSNIDFKFRYGSNDTIERTSIQDGTFNISNDIGALSVDLEGKRVYLSDIILGHTEAEIRALPMPNIQKIYFAKDTFNLLSYSESELTWKRCSGEVSPIAIKALNDNLGNQIDLTYQTKQDSIFAEEMLQNQIDDLHDTVASINRFNVIKFDEYGDLPEVGTKFVIYLVPNISDNGDESNTTANGYAEYIWITTEEAHTDYSDPDNPVEVPEEGYYEQIGLTTVDLAEYYTKDEIDSIKAELETSIGNVDTKADGIANDLSDFQTNVSDTYLSKSDAADTYLTKTNATSTYLTQNNASSTYLTRTDATNTYDTKENVSNTYLSKSDASSTYLSKNDASNTYLTKEEAAEFGQASSIAETYLSKSDASSTYLSKTDAGTTYLSKTDASDTYLSKTDASSTYAISSNVSDTYLSKSDATSIYLSKTDASNTYLTKEEAAEFGQATAIAETYLSKNDASSTYLSKTDAVVTYATSSSVSNTYLSKSDASSTYLTQSDASDIYLAKDEAASITPDLSEIDCGDEDEEE